VSQIHWLVYAIGALALWGAWGILGKLGCRTTEASHYIPLVIIGNLVVLIIAAIFMVRTNHLRVASTDNMLVILSSAAYALGGILYFVALAKGNLLVVVLLTASYPVVTVILSFIFLGETVSVAKIFGIVAVTVGVLLLSI